MEEMYRPKLASILLGLYFSLMIGVAADAATVPSKPLQAFGPKQDENYDFFFSIQDQSKLSFQGFHSPQSILGHLAEDAAKSDLGLLQWRKHDEPIETPTEKYNRTQHFGRWVNDPTDANCYNTRAKVLIRDSVVPVTFKGKNLCVVDKGEWHDPYSGNTFTDAKDVQIDHFVALKNAYLNGAWRWPKITRCMYANFQANDFHLLSVFGSENMSKGDGAPDRYIPSNDAYVCQYLENWLKVKLIWNLTIVPPEADAIVQLVNQFNCSVEKFSLTEEQLQKQRQAIVKATQQCQRRAPAPEQTQTPTPTNP